LAGFPESCGNSVSQESPGGEKAPAALQGVTQARCTPGLTAYYAGSLSGSILQSEYAPIGAAALRRLAARARRQTISAFKPLIFLGSVQGRNKLTLQRRFVDFSGYKRDAFGIPRVDLERPEKVTNCFLRFERVQTETAKTMRSNHGN